MIRTIASNIRNAYLNQQSLNTEEFDTFKEKYPTFFKMLLSQDMDVDMYTKLLDMLDKMNNNETDSFSAAGEFSQFGATKYMYNTFGKPSENDIKKASDKLKKQFNQ